MEDIPFGFVTRLFKIQQDDELTILRMSGLLAENDRLPSGSWSSNFLVSDIYAELTGYIDAQIGDNQEARLLLSDLLLPPDKLQRPPKSGFKYTEYEGEDNEEQYETSENQSDVVAAKLDPALHHLPAATFFGSELLVVTST